MPEKMPVAAQPLTAQLGASDLVCLCGSSRCGAAHAETAGALLEVGSAQPISFTSGVAFACCTLCKVCRLFIVYAGRAHQSPGKVFEGFPDPNRLDSSLTK